MHFPDDRRIVFALRRPYWIWLAVVVVVPLGAAWLQFAMFGIHPQAATIAAGAGRGFPIWIRWTHFSTILFLFLIARSGLSVLMDHARLYWSDDCTPGTEWLRFTPLAVPKDRMWTAKDDARYVSPILALPGYRHTVGMARSWHFITDYGFVLTGIVYVAMLFFSGQWPRLVPTSWSIVPYAWSSFVQYATFHFPSDPNGYYAYNALQQLAYFGVVFVMAPLSILTGIAMSPAADNAFGWFARLFGGRQAARSLHFLLLAGFGAFAVVHVWLVLATGAARNFNHIVLGTDDLHPMGLILGCVGLAVVVASWFAAHVVAWRRPRLVQRLAKLLVLPPELRASASKSFDPAERYTRSDVSQYFWPNGKLPDSSEWLDLAAGGFGEYRLHIGGCVRNAVDLSLADLRALGGDENVSLQHCIQGWSGIAQWGGVSMQRIVDLVDPLKAARAVAFVSFGGGTFGGTYYETQRIEDVVKPECMLAYDMNGAPLGHVHGAPLRLRVENQLGFKMVKWIREIRFLESERDIGKGFGGISEDEEYFDLLPYI